MIYMPMYKKSLCILLLIALLTGGVIFYNYYSRDSISLETVSDDISENTPVNVNNNTEVTVYVSGEINSPGVVTLDSSCRIKDAVAACGDFTPLADKNSINLAQKLTDGMQINIPAMPQNQTSVTGSNSNSNADSAKDSGENTMININTANKEELDTLPGIGPATADKIIEYRETNGHFTSIEDIKNVRGIGEAKFSKIQSRIRI